MGVMPKSIFTKANKKNNDILSILSNILTHKLNKLYKGENSDLTLVKCFVHVTAVPLNGVFRCIYVTLFIVRKDVLRYTLLCFIPTFIQDASVHEAKVIEKILVEANTCYLI